MRRAKILAIQLTIGVVLLESLLRIFQPLPFMLHGREFDLPVGLQYRRQNPVDPRLTPVTVETRNSLGFRGPEPPADLGSRFSIVAVGGSTTENSLLTDGTTWPELLGERLAAARPDTWVNNAGFNGHSTHGHLMLLRAILVPMKPRMMLVLAGVNDIGVDAGANEFERPIGVWDHIARRSEIANGALNLFRAWRASRMPFAGNEVLDFSALPTRVMTDAEIEAEIAPLMRQRGDYEARLTALANEARAAGIAPVFITQPALVGDMIDPTTGLDLRSLVLGRDRTLFDETDRFNGLGLWRLLERYNDVMRHTAARLGVPLIDLARALPKDTRYYCDFIHHSNLGAAVVAEIVAAELLPLLPRR